MFLSDENENNDNDSSGSFFFSWFRHCIAPQLHASLNAKVRGQAEQQPWSWSPAQRHLRKANASATVSHRA